MPRRPRTIPRSPRSVALLSSGMRGSSRQRVSPGQKPSMYVIAWRWCARRRRGRARALLRRRAEERVLALGEQLLEKFEFEFGGGPGVAAQAGEFGGQGLELGVEPIVLALEEHRDLTEHLRIADRIETEHLRTTSSRRVRRKIFLRRRDHKGRGRECDAPDERAAFEEELQFAHGEAHDPRLGVPPQAGEPSKPFRRSAGAPYAQTATCRVDPIIRAPAARRRGHRDRALRRGSRAG